MNGEHFRIVMRLGRRWSKRAWSWRIGFTTPTAHRYTAPTVKHGHARTRKAAHRAAEAAVLEATGCES